MKIKLTPELSYLIGFWSRRKCAEGVGIEGSKEAHEIFIQQVLDQKLAEPNKILTDGDKVYFYHGKYRKFFQEIEEEKLERYKYINEYSANYLAGVFDSAGNINERGVVYLERFWDSDEMLFFRLGFPTRIIDGKMVIGRPKAFLAFIRNYTKVFANHPVMNMVKKKVR